MINLKLQYNKKYTDSDENQSVYLISLLDFGVCATHIFRVLFSNLLFSLISYFMSYNNTIKCTDSYETYP